MHANPVGPVGNSVLIVGGVHLGGPGYPNAQCTLRALQAEGVASVVECGAWLPKDFRLWQLAKGGLWTRITSLARLALGNLFSVLRAVPAAWYRSAPIYVPYPAIPFLWLCSWIPKKVRPRLIADAYVSLWDSMVMDRKDARASGPAARWLHRIEGRALRTADLVVVDTQANAEYLATTFGLTPERVHAIPLAVIEPPSSRLTQARQARSIGRFRVLYVGTLVPLHGIDRLLQGIAPLLQDDRFEFILIGDGQEAPIVEAFSSKSAGGGLTWIRDWLPPDELDTWIASADVCLGVFGGTGKAARVLPLKLYLYLAHGRIVVSQSAQSLPTGVPPAPFLGIDPSHPEQISQALLSLLGQAPEALSSMEQQSRDYFQHNLSNTRVADAWRRLLRAAPP